MTEREHRCLGETRLGSGQVTRDDSSLSRGTGPFQLGHSGGRDYVSKDKGARKHKVC